MIKKLKPIPDVIVYKDNAGNGIFSDETYITTELGGEAHRLRNYVVISALNNKPFTNKQRGIIKKQFNLVSKKHDSKIEEIEFSKNYALIKILISVEVAPQELIDAGMNTCDDIEKFLRFHFYCTNVKKPSKKVIKDYLNEITEKKAN
ncbi:hypothetical protein HYU96_04575 [Candidatus Daviesbacteria bacterium]|nr:hypothetical protein [Candidatus Daviesbacteria bacterium]